ncbi:GAF domain-containing protein [Flavobacterium bizetiae]|uniref:ATP-binding protein n=1 Tax=Flavobacterium bizetiae TaxID=2704140 RepID=UPI0021E817B6|nr:ATP-binding protein [Flavobacterium bizetiae]UTN03306.1 GAF domain-containing protein [Flavobacterium bizetiae]
MKIRDIVNRDIVTLTNCEHEPIHIPGSIQPHGFLLGINLDWKIEFCTANINEFLDLVYKDILGRKFSEIFGAPAQKELYDYVHNQKEQSVFPLELQLKGILFQIAIHKSGPVYVLEAEPQLRGKEQMADLYAQTIQFVSNMNNTRSLKELCALVAEGTREITGYDRVMIYRFDENYNGEVFAESCREDLEPFLGLHYPHTDIPVQARELYMKNLLRLIVDIGYEPVPIFTIDDQENKNLDLSLSTLRSTSPIHVEYLKNMGVGATLTISLIHHDRLWGLIACHHYSPKNISPEIRLAAKLQGQFITAQIDLRQLNDEYEIARKTNKALERLTALNLPLEQHSFEIICADIELLKLCNATGVSICIGDKTYKNGITPPDEDINKIISAIAINEYGKTFSTNKLSNHVPDLVSYEHVSGIIYFSLGNDNNIIWYRPETVGVINWAGDPEKAIIIDSNGLHPRNSFNLWKQIIKHQSEVWLQPELNAALSYAHFLHNQIILLMLSDEEEKYRNLSDVLRETNLELENINWISTHDLQEPLRKIQLIASKVLSDTSETPSIAVLDSLQRITKSANRMQNLLIDILKYTRIKNTIESFQKVSLNYIMEETLQDMKEIILENKAIVECENLPEIHAVPFLMKQLFSNIMQNSLKYASINRPPVIKVTASQEPEINEYSNKVYCHWVTFTDNGIGFEQQYAESIFKIFTRLHTLEKYDGSGVGLALCKKIMQTCNGNIRAVGKLNEGTEITIYFPCDPDDSLIAK